MYTPFMTSQIMALLSTDPEIRLLPSGDQDRSYTSSMWPLQKKDKKNHTLNCLCFERKTTFSSHSHMQIDMEFEWFFYSKNSVKEVWRSHDTLASVLVLKA